MLLGQKAFIFAYLFAVFASLIHKTKFNELKCKPCGTFKVQPDVLNV